MFFFHIRFHIGCVVVFMIFYHYRWPKTNFIFRNILLNRVEASFITPFCPNNHNTKLHLLFITHSEYGYGFILLLLSLLLQISEFWIWNCECIYLIRKWDMASMNFVFIVISRCSWCVCVCVCLCQNRWKMAWIVIWII